MKHVSAIVGLSLLALTARAALPQPDLIAQIHFAGAKKISADAHAAAFTNEFCSAEALALRAQTAGKLSGWLAGWLQTNLNARVADGPARLRPLVDDLQQAEWFLEARTTASGKPAVGLAIRLDPARAQLWQANLKPFFAAATFQTTGGWLIFDSDPATLKLSDRLAQKISALTAGWLDLDINWPRLAQWLPAAKELGLPETQFTVTAPDNNFRINGKFLFPDNLALNLEPWQAPTNTLHMPFDSFTAVRGFAKWFQSQAWAQPYQMTPTPNQLFVWSLMMAPFQTYAAVPVPDAAKALTQADARLEAAFSAANARNDFLSPITPQRTNDQVAFTGMPFIGPVLRGVTGTAGQFLNLELFPNTPRATPLPPELFGWLAPKDLVYYHWEMTSKRVPQLLQVTQFGLLISLHKQLPGDSAGFKWLQKTGAALGATDTEITRSGPAELTFTRKAPGLFTAMELYALANWLEAPNFPGCNLKLPPRSERLKLLRQQHPQPGAPKPAPAPAPAPAPGH